MDLEESVKQYRELAKTIEELEEQKKVLSRHILQLLPLNTKSMVVATYQVKRYSRLSIKTSLEEAKAFDAIKTEEVVDKDKIKQLLQQGLFIPGVSESEYIQVSSSSKKESISPVF